MNSGETSLPRPPVPSLHLQVQLLCALEGPLASMVTPKPLSDVCLLPQLEGPSLCHPCSCLSMLSSPSPGSGSWIQDTAATQRRGLDICNVTAAFTGS